MATVVWKSGNFPDGAVDAADMGSILLVGCVIPNRGDMAKPSEEGGGTGGGELLLGM